MRSTVVGSLLGLLLLAGCSSGGAAATHATTSPFSPTSTAAPSSGTTGCPAAASGQPSGVPGRADSKPTLDVDGDGRRDTLYLDDETAVGGGVVFGIQTASGGNFFTDFNSASPVGRSVLVADVTGHGQLIALASDGRQVLLYAISNCSFVPVLNTQGTQYTFSLGFTGFGTGVGCADVDGDGTRDLVGLLADGTTVTSTAVVLHGPRATNGKTSRVADATAAQVERAHQVTCGDLTMDASGVSVAG